MGLLLGSVTTIINASEAESIGSRPRTVPELIDYWGYPVETHWVTTSDDYILTLHRIPHTSGVDDLKPIAFLLHGLFGTSARWTLGPPTKLIKAGNVFRKYDYGWEENQSRYNGSMTPPHFNLSDINTPLYL